MKISPLIYSAMVFLLITVSPNSAYAQEQVANFEGGWNMTLHINGNKVPSWLEIKPWGHIRVGTFLHIGGYPRPLSVINVENDHFNFAVPWESEDNILKVAGKMVGDSLQGDIHYPGGKSYKWSAVRVPE